MDDAIYIQLIVRGGTLDDAEQLANMIRMAINMAGGGNLNVEVGQITTAEEIPNGG